MIEEIVNAWGWVGIIPREIVDENAFGNLLIKDANGKYWRLCPEELSCEIVANGDKAFEAFFQDEDFASDWSMERLVDEAWKKLGTLPKGRKYCLKIPAPLGGKYDEENLATVSFVELVRFSGNLARQIEDLPDGAEVEFKIVKEDHP